MKRKFSDLVQKVRVSGYVSKNEEDVKQMREFLQQMTENELDRFEQFRRSHLNRNEIRKVITEFLEQMKIKVKETNSICVIVGGLTKIFLGDVIEAAREMMTQKGDYGRIQPCHIQDALRSVTEFGHLAVRPRGRPQNAKLLDDSIGSVTSATTFIKNIDYDKLFASDSGMWKPFEQVECSDQVEEDVSRPNKKSNVITLNNQNLETKIESKDSQLPSLSISTPKKFILVGDDDNNNDININGDDDNDDDNDDNSDNIASI